jgi:hypothetical protein
MEVLSIGSVLILLLIFVVVLSGLARTSEFICVLRGLGMVTLPELLVGLTNWVVPRMRENFNKVFNFQ